MEGYIPQEQHDAAPANDGRLNSYALMAARMIGFQLIGLMSGSHDISAGHAELGLHPDADSLHPTAELVHYGPSSDSDGAGFIGVSRGTLSDCDLNTTDGIGRIMGDASHGSYQADRITDSLDDRAAALGRRVDSSVCSDVDRLDGDLRADESSVSLWSKVLQQAYDKHLSDDQYVTYFDPNTHDEVTVKVRVVKLALQSAINDYRKDVIAFDDAGAKANDTITTAENRQAVPPLRPSSGSTPPHHRGTDSGTDSHGNHKPDPRGTWRRGGSTGV